MKNIQTLQQQEKQAWKLYYKLSQKIYQKSPFGDHYSAIYTPSHRHCRIANRAFDRWIRRQQKLEIALSSGGLARPPLAVVSFEEGEFF